jgi:hypothetical protein
MDVRHTLIPRMHGNILAARPRTEISESLPVYTSVGHYFRAFVTG